MDSFVIYRSFHEALKELSREQYGNVMYSINEYALNNVEPELSGVEKMAFTLIKPQIDANIKKQENGKYGALGGRPKKKNPDQKEGLEIKNPMGYFFDGNENPNANANANENANSNENVDIPHAPAPDDLNPAVQNYAKAIFELYKDADLPCCLENFSSFYQCDFKLALEELHTNPALKGLHSNDVFAAVKNYILVLNTPGIYQGWQSRKPFDSFVSWPKFRDFLPGRFVLKNFLEHKKVPSESAGGIGLEQSMQILDEVSQ